MVNDRLGASCGGSGDLMFFEDAAVVPGLRDLAIWSSAARDAALPAGPRASRLSAVVVQEPGA